MVQSILQRVTCAGQTSERFRLAKGKQTIGQQIYALNREALAQLLSLAEGLFAQGQSSEQLTEIALKRHQE